MSNAPVDELLAQGRMALSTLKYREQAAMYRAATLSLQAALLRAESGEGNDLERWLEMHRDLMSNPEPTGYLQPVRAGDTPSAQGSALQELFLSTEVEPCAESPACISPWQLMERGAEERLRETSSLQPDAPRPDYFSLDDLAIPPCGPGVSPGVAKAPPGETPGPRTNRMAQEDTPLEPEDTSQDDSSAEDPWEEGAWEEESLEEELTDEEVAEIAAITEPAPSPEPVTGWRSYLTPPIWFSLGGHGTILLVLSFVVMRHIQETKPTGIVSAPYESDRILTETPLETMGPLNSTELEEMEFSDPSLSLPSVNTSRFGDSPLPSLDLPGGAGMQLAGGLSSESLSQAIVATPVSTGGNKLTAGAEFFGVKATGSLFIYIVDCSPSMRRDNAFEAAKLEIGRSLQSMKEAQRYYIFFFGKDVERMELSIGTPEEYPVHATPENVRKTLEWLGRTAIQREGWPPNDALKAAIAMQPDGIFLLFDGDTRVDVASYLSRINRTTDLFSPGQPKVPIHVVHFFLEEYAPSMRKVAQENQGTYRFIPRQKRNGR